MKPFTRVLSAFAVGILLQGGVYLYLDQYIFAPTTELRPAGWPRTAASAAGRYTTSSGPFRGDSARF